MPKPSVAYVNGQILPIEQAAVSVLDRGFLFADGVYEVAAVVHGRLVDNPAHMGRLKRSLRAMNLRSPVALAELPNQMQELVDREELREGMVYLQITRGADTSRNFPFPRPDHVPSTLVMFVQEKTLIDNPLARRGGKAITLPDMRWQRRDIKSIALLPQVLGKQAAIDAGADEAWLVEDGYVTEGTSAAAGIVTRQGELVTRPVTSEVLDSITCRALLQLVADLQLPHQSRRFTVAEAYQAVEAFNASATALIMPIVEIDGHPIGAGVPGPIVTRLRAIYLEMATSPNPVCATFPSG